MYAKTKNKSANKIALFGSVKILVACAMFIAFSIVFGKFLAINIGDNIRLSLENLSLILAGILFGPKIGLFTAIAADIVGCIVRGYEINPIITLGAACIGFFSGFMYLYVFKNNLVPRVALSVFTAHIIGSMIVKSIGLYIYFPPQRVTLIWRIPSYLIIGTIETIIICALLKNKVFSSQFERLKNK